MNPTAAHFDMLLERFVEWARGQEKIRSTILIGSRARQDHPTDEASDMDLIFISPDPQYYLCHL